MTFTSEEFEAAIVWLKAFTRDDPMNSPETKIINAALQMAARAMKPGLIEEAADEGGQDTDVDKAAAAIRKALTA